ncbi:hypothetical protein DFH11DRAFT_1734446 [Phellopilus nigrolimitatus]|nr:hypothetical protein DFH11DRAFT_1734446 [Phellopilus nigrolimitatus]
MKITYQGWHTHHELASYRLAVCADDRARDTQAERRPGPQTAVGVAGAAFSEDVAGAIDALCADPIIPRIMDHSSEFNLMDSTSYFFFEVARFGYAGYVPTAADVLRVRAKRAPASSRRAST